MMVDGVDIIFGEVLRKLPIGVLPKRKRKLSFVDLGIEEVKG